MSEHVTFTLLLMLTAGRTTCTRQERAGLHQTQLHVVAGDTWRRTSRTVTDICSVPICSECAANAFFSAPRVVTRRRRGERLSRLCRRRPMVCQRGRRGMTCKLSEIVFLPFSGDRPLLYLLSSDYMIPDSLPSFCMNVLHTGLGC